MRALRIGLGAAALAAMVGCGSDGKEGPAGAAGAGGAAGAPGTPGAQGNPGQPGESVQASAGVVFPRAGLLDRELDVMVTVDAAKVDASTQLDFGAGITLSNVAVASSTALTAHLKIDATAAAGPRDVKIRINTAQELTAKGGFDVKHPAEMRVLGGTPTAGGMARVEITSRDTAAFETSMRADGGLWLRTLERLTSTRWIGTVVFDPLGGTSVTPRVYNVEPTSFAPGTSYPMAPVTLGAATITNVAPTVATPVNTTAQGLAAAFASRTYKVSTTEAGILRIRTSNVGAQLTGLSVMTYGATGKTDSALILSNDVYLPVLAVATDHYAVVGSPTSTGGTGTAFEFDLNTSIVAAPITTDSGAGHATSGAAQAMTITTNAGVVDGTIGAAGEVDWYSFTTTGTTGLSFVSDADLTITLVNAAAVDQFTLNTTSSRITSFGPFLGAGTYFWRVQPRAGAVANTRATGKYKLAVFP
jgi:hypothetical protein